MSISMICCKTIIAMACLQMNTSAKNRKSIVKSSVIIARIMMIQKDTELSP